MVERSILPHRKQALAGAALALGGLLIAGAAHAGTSVQWSIGISAPIAPGVAVGTLIGSAPGYGGYGGYGYGGYVAAPAYVAPAPVYAPPVYVEPAPVVYAPAPIYVAPRHYVHRYPVFAARPVHGAVVPRWHGGWQGHRGGDGRVAWDGR
jgi:hypothetical protein